MQSYYVDERLRDGILVEATFPPPGVGYSAGSLPGSGAELQGMLAQYGHTTALGLIVSDHGAGRVRRTAAGTLMLYSLGREDVRRVLHGIALAAELQLAAGAREVHTLLPGLPPLRSRGELALVTEGRWAASDLKLSAYHPMGTCRMGADPRTSVVDAYGRAHDLPGLTIADASILPGSTYVNPQVSIMALATRVAWRLAG
jgi:choline dehydrogenase-like flavoprotein